jgi:hypothetical protein
MRCMEHATVDSHGAAPELSAAVSLAKAAGVTVTVAARHLQNGTAKTLIQSRVAERKMNEQHIERIERLTELRIRDIALLSLASG